MRPADGGTFQGINPQLLAQLMKSLSDGVTRGQPLANSYVGQFGRLGLDTSNASKLLADFGWASGQQAMLHRRYDLASNQPSGSWEDGFATAGAGSLQWATAAQARAAGAQATKEYQDGKISFQQYLTLIEENQGDPDWSTGAIKALGPDGLSEVEAQLKYAYPPDQQGTQSLAMAVAAAMANGVTYPDDPDAPNSEDLDLLAPLLPYASFPPKVLVTLGNEVTMGGPNSDPYPAENVLNALAADPQAAAQFLAQFPQAHGGEQVGQYITVGSDHRGGLPPDLAPQFAKVITAGTVGAKGSDPSLATANVNSLVSFYANNPGDHTYGPIQAAYGGIVKAYWPVVAYAITTVTPQESEQGLGPADGIKAGPSQWAAFIDEAMRDPGAAALMMSNARAQAEASQQLAAKQPGDKGSVYAFRAGQIDGFFDYQAMTVYQELSKESAGEATNWKEMAQGDVIDLVFDVASDPASAEATVPISLGKDGVEALVSFLENDVQTDAKPTSPDYSTWQQALSDQARYDFNETTPQLRASDPERASFVASAQSYASGSSNFVRDGQIMDPASMSPAQLQAYDSWLNSPGVVNYVENHQFGQYENGFSTWWDTPPGS